MKFETLNLKLGESDDEIVVTMLEHRVSEVIKVLKKDELITESPGWSFIAHTTFPYVVDKPMLEDDSKRALLCNLLRSKDITKMGFVHLYRNMRRSDFTLWNRSFSLQEVADTPGSHLIPHKYCSYSIDTFGVKI